MAPDEVVPAIVRFEAVPEAIASVLVPPSVPLKVSAPPEAVIAEFVIVPLTEPWPVMAATVKVPPDCVTEPPDKATAALTVPTPLNVAPLPIVSPDASVRVPPLNRIVPLVMLSAPVIVRLPLAPTCNV